MILEGMCCLVELRGLEPLTPCLQTEHPRGQTAWHGPFPQFRGSAASAFTESDCACRCLTAPTLLPEPDRERWAYRPAIYVHSDAEDQLHLDPEMGSGHWLVNYCLGGRLGPDLTCHPAARARFGPPASDLDDSC